MIQSRPTPENTRHTRYRTSRRPSFARFTREPTMPAKVCVKVRSKISPKVRN